MVNVLEFANKIAQHYTGEEDEACGECIEILEEFREAVRREESAKWSQRYFDLGKQMGEYSNEIQDLRDGKWLPFTTAPQNGVEIIGWLSSDKGFQDTTANIVFHEDCWSWADSLDPIKRPDLIHGWQHYPDPPEKK